MPYEFLETAGLTRIRHTGKVSADEIRRVGDALRAKEVRRFLVDFRDAESTPSEGEFYLLVSSFSAQETVRLRCAIVHNAAQTKHFEFLELTARNQGLSIRAFLDEDAALAWLTD